MDDKKNIAIVILAAKATVLIALHMLLPDSAEAATVMKDRDYQLVTSRVQGGGEALYVTDNRTGLVAVFTYDSNARSVVAKAVRPMGELFAGARRAEDDRGSAR